MAASFPAQVVAVVFRRAAVFQPPPGELATFPGRVFRRATAAQRRRVEVPGGSPDVAAASPAQATAPGSVTTSDRHLAGSPVLAAIEARARARDLARDVGLALARAHDLIRARGSALDLDRDRDVALALARALAHDLAFDLGLARDLALDLHRDRNRVRARARSLVRDLVRDLARGSALELELALGPDRVLALDLVRALVRSLALGLVLARDLARDLASSEIDASGADLSRGDFSDLSLLEGVIWSRQTVWPPGVAEQVAQLSEEIAPDVYRIRGGSERDRSGLVTI